jgi:hypothetical protein
MKLAISGPRDLRIEPNDVRFYVMTSGFEPTHINVGDAKGVDDAVRQYAAKYFPDNWDRYDADWNGYDKQAGPIRNRRMVQDSDALIAFIRAGSRPVTSGTASAIAEAVVKGIPIFIVEI